MPSIQISEKLISFVTFLPIFFISLSVHEFAHAYAASKLGDNTAKILGRLTLNPFKHADLIGTYLMPLASLTSGFALIGWAKPVPINRANFKNDLKDDAIVSFAGPFSNLILSVLFFILFVISARVIPGDKHYILNFCWYGVFLNIFLSFFNLLPIPPLDGSHILYDLFPGKLTAKLLRMGIFGSILLMFFIYSPLWSFFMNFINLVLSLFVKTANFFNV
ncbi:MAG: site-2 protease family protein [Ignavibacteriaceae bacterium]|nr:site-2 protease family protein [Ignavibacteriaceae bacterium]